MATTVFIRLERRGNRKCQGRNCGLSSIDEFFSSNSDTVCQLHLRADTSSTTKQSEVQLGILSEKVDGFMQQLSNQVQQSNEQITDLHQLILTLFQNCGMAAQTFVSVTRSQSIRSNPHTHVVAEDEVNRESNS